MQKQMCHYQHSAQVLALRTLENTNVAHSIVSNTPALGLVLFSRKYLACDGRWQNFVEPEELSSFHARSFGKFTDRLRLFSRPQISFRLAVLPSTPLSKALCSMQFRISESPLRSLLGGTPQQWPNFMS